MESNKSVGKNLVTGIIVAVYFVLLNMAYQTIGLEKVINDMRIISGIVLVISVVMIEVAYKKDNGYLGGLAIELMVVTFITLSIDYVIRLISINRELYLYGLAGVFFGYYVIKALVNVTARRKMYAESLSDIPEIVKLEKPQKKDTQKKTTRETKKALERNERKLEQMKTKSKHIDKIDEAIKFEKELKDDFNQIKQLLEEDVIEEVDELEEVEPKEEITAIEKEKKGFFFARKKEKIKSVTEEEPKEVSKIVVTEMGETPNLIVEEVTAKRKTTRVKKERSVKEEIQEETPKKTKKTSKPKVDETDEKPAKKVTATKKTTTKKAVSTSTKKEPATSKKTPAKKTTKKETEETKKTPAKKTTTKATTKKTVTKKDSSKKTEK